MFVSIANIKILVVFIIKYFILDYKNSCLHRLARKKRPCYSAVYAE